MQRIERRSTPTLLYPSCVRGKGIRGSAGRNKRSSSSFASSAIDSKEITRLRNGRRRRPF